MGANGNPLSWSLVSHFMAKPACSVKMFITKWIRTFKANIHMKKIYIFHRFVGVFSPLKIGFANCKKDRVHKLQIRKSPHLQKICKSTKFEKSSSLRIRELQNLRIFGPPLSKLPFIFFYVYFRSCNHFFPIIIIQCWTFPDNWMFSLGKNRPQYLSMGYILQKINVHTPVCNTPSGLALKIIVKV